MFYSVIFMVKCLLKFCSESHSLRDFYLMFANSLLFSGFDVHKQLAMMKVAVGMVGHVDENK